MPVGHRSKVVNVCRLCYARAGTSVLVAEHYLDGVQRQP